MSGQWEVVGKKKDRSNSKLPVPKVNGSNNIKESKSKNLLNGVKIEEVLPKSQLQSLYGKNKENKKPVEKSKVQEPVKKAPKKEKVQEAIPKPKPPKSIESALNLIDVEEFRSIFEKSKAHFPDAPIVWLKELVHFLSQKVSLEVHDPFFTNKPDNYPLYVVPSGIKAIIEKSVKEAKKENAQLFFDICLTSMATDMGKGLPALGNRFYLQYIARTEPKLVVQNIAKYVSLRNSYQNRANIGLAILWAVGQVGHVDFYSGLTVFQELFLPLIDHKNYSRTVANYLLMLLNKSQDPTLTRDQYLLILDTIFSSKKNFPTDLKNALVSQTVGLERSLFKNSKEKYHSYVELFLKKIAGSSEKCYSERLCAALCEIFVKDSTTLASWVKVYSKNVAASAVLLTFILENWGEISKKVSKNDLNHLLESFSATNRELSTKRRAEDGLKDSIAAITKINDKMVAKKSGGFPFKTLTAVLFIALGGFIYYDINTHGSFKASKTALTLHEYKICEYSRLALAKANEGYSWTLSRIDETFPGYRQTAFEYVEPYLELFSDLFKITRNGLFEVKEVCVEKYPHVVESIRTNLPGLLEQSQKMLTNAYTTSVFYFNRSVDYLKKEVFVGQLSPENVQRVVIEAFNTTQQKAVEYYHWIYEKVQMSVK